jgi:hypothetical protein
MTDFRPATIPSYGRDLIHHHLRRHQATPAGIAAGDQIRLALSLIAAKGVNVLRHQDQSQKSVSNHSLLPREPVPSEIVTTS